MKQQDYVDYLGPFAWRYGSDEMRQVFSVRKKYLLWRKIWVILAKAQYRAGALKKEEYEDLAKNETNIDIARIGEIEKDTHHDIVAALKEFAEKAPLGGKKLHLGATSMDIVDTADSIKLKLALRIIEKNLRELLLIFAKKIKRYADVACMGYTHLQPAEPTTLGYRLAFYGQDLLQDFYLFQFVKSHLKTKGMKGAVGTSASYIALFGKKNSAQMEQDIMNELGLTAFPVTHQTTPRKTEYWVSAALASTAQSLYKFAFDLRFMQSAGIGEWQEPFGQKQVGSSAMPFKKNPVKAERICSLARLVINFSRMSLDNASLSLLERTFDDSANRRVYIPEMFMALDEILRSAIKMVDGLLIYPAVIEKNLQAYSPFAATEAILIEAVKNGGDRQRLHEVLRKISLAAWQAVQSGKENPLKALLLENKILGRYIKKNGWTSLFDVSRQVGGAPQRSRLLVEKIKAALA
ncbi:adenylosuccinate lyase [Candidatus Roizmanbacteria bacterium]|nr:adenylosuccinate lyase [Candidatus Roizmanbacteria bacterium]